MGWTSVTFHSRQLTFPGVTATQFQSKAQFVADSSLAVVRQKREQKEAIQDSVAAHPAAGLSVRGPGLGQIIYCYLYENSCSGVIVITSFKVSIISFRLESQL